MELKGSPRFRSKIVPRFSDFDLQGILNSRQYLDLVGEARTDQMKNCYKIPMERYTERNQSFVLRSFQIDYKKPIHFGTSFEIETWVEEMRGSMAEIKFRFLDADKNVIFADGSATYFLVDLETKKIVRFNEEEFKVYLGLG